MTKLQDMYKKEQVERIRIPIAYWLVHNNIKAPKEQVDVLLGAMIDAGIGDKDRFEMREGLRPWRGESKVFIKPINYKENSNG